VRWVDRLPSDASERVTWDESQVKAFIAIAGQERLAACWLLSVLGLRRGEVLGLKWADISFTEGTLTVRRARVLVGGQVIEKSPKSRRGGRTLPLFKEVTDALKALSDLQEIEAMAAGAAYAASGYVAADELGGPVHPERYSDEFARLVTAAGLPVCRLHDCRHTVNSLMEKKRVPLSVRAAWFGHRPEVNAGTYTHASAADLAVASAAVSDFFQPV
jgi:integrase